MLRWLVTCLRVGDFDLVVVLIGCYVTIVHYDCFWFLLCYSSDGFLLFCGGFPVCVAFRFDVV